MQFGIGVKLLTKILDIWFTGPKMSESLINSYLCLE